MIVLLTHIQQLLPNFTLRITYFAFEHVSWCSLLTALLLRDAWKDAASGTSKCRWSVSNLGVEQDEGITSTEIRGQALHTPQNNTATQAGHGIPHLLTSTFKRSRFIFCQQSLSQLKRGGMCCCLLVLAQGFLVFCDFYISRENEKAEKFSCA